ncbi:carbon-nitrogen hydrolase family protein [Lysinibacter cavernae]|uniref:Putative amidohydrolase n=1 Tax=Lysinibacter cavernae TaxID=1640652 RepID=A0A7X5QZL3_9MICO|nr:carbon-nitrogen hydrolase family protein [Lysinibacter cavernae]NIH52715.1 putative amidohydrolase [Lysinibacter cavernae]
MKIALAQVVTGANLAENLRIVEDRVIEAAERGADLVVFPEATMRAFGNSLLDIAEPLDGPWVTSVRQFARVYGITIIVGVFTQGDNDRVVNTLVVAQPDGLSSYNKMHLFDAFGYAESESVLAGESPTVTTISDVNVGLAVCYDLRFPALFAQNAAAGAVVNVVSASWGAGECKIEQWMLLARARALDTTTFVVACGQADPKAAGVPAVPNAPTGVGHSLVVAPDGTVLAEAGAGEELLVVDLDLTLIESTRRQLPVLANQRFRSVRA